MAIETNNPKALAAARKTLVKFIESYSINDAAPAELNKFSKNSAKFLSESAIKNITKGSTEPDWQKEVSQAKEIFKNVATQIAKLEIEPVVNDKSIGIRYIKVAKQTKGFCGFSPWC